MMVENGPAFRACILLATAVMAVGCHQHKKVPPENASSAQELLQEPKRLAPFHVRAVPSDRDKSKAEGPKVEIYDAAELFRRAAALYRIEHFQEAENAYLRVAEEFGLSEYAAPSLYNAGLSAEQLGEFSVAWSHYDKLTVQYPSSKDITDALFRMMGCAEALETWEEVVSTADKLLRERKDITNAETIECLARKGAALVAIGDDINAANALKEAIFRFRKEAAVNDKTGNYYAAMARFKLGEISERKMHLWPLPSDEAFLQGALEKKCSLLLDAQIEYTDAIRMGNAHWASAAAYRIGKLYRTLWQDMTDAPPPVDLNEAERDVYVEVLKKRIEVLLKKAIAQWERVLKMSERLELKNEWIEKASIEIEDIKSLIKQDNSRTD